MQNQEENRLASQDILDRKHIPHLKDPGKYSTMTYYTIKINSLLYYSQLTTIWNKYASAQSYINWPHTKTC